MAETTTTTPSDPIDEFIALPRDQQLTTLQKLAPDKQDALLNQIKTRQQAKAQPTTTAPTQQPQPDQSADWDVMGNLRRIGGAYGQFERAYHNAQARSLENLPGMAADIIAPGSRAMLPAITQRAEQLPVVGPMIQRGISAVQQRAAEPNVTLPAMAGNAVENIIEAVSGNEALKGASALTKIKMLSPLIDVLEKKSPALVPILESTLRQGAVGNVQARAKGATPIEAAETGLLAGATGAVGEGVGAGLQQEGQAAREAIQAAQPEAENILGAEVPRFAAQRPGVSPRVASAITPTTNPEIAAAQQAGARQAYANLATRIAQRGADLFGRTAEPVTDVGQAAEQLKNLGNDIYDQLDSLTQNQFRDLNSAVSEAKASGNPRAEQRAVQNMLDYFNGYDDANFADSLRTAAVKGRDIWTRHYAAETIHDALNRSFTLPSQQIAEETGQARELVGPKLKTSLDNLVNKLGRPELDRIMGADAVPSLYRMAQITDNPESLAKARTLASDVVRIVAKHSTGAAIGGLIGHLTPGVGWTVGAAIGAPLAAAPEAMDVARNRVLYTLATTPRLANMLNYAVNNISRSSYAAQVLAVGLEQEAARQRRMEERQNQQGATNAGSGNPPPNPNRPVATAPRADARPGPYVTQLNPQQEQQFQQWVRDNNIPFRDEANSDYDMRGYFLDNVIGGQGQGTRVSQFDQRPHFPDTYKTPYHRTFSNESRYALPTAPHWEGDRLIDSQGNVVADETPRPRRR